MAPDTGAGAPFLDEMDAGVDSYTERSEKWFRTHRDVRIGDVMMILSPDTPGGCWPLGRVLDVYPEKDGHVRVAKLQVGQGTLTRPVNKLCALELEH